MAAESALVAASARGDRDALAALWRRHRRWVAAVLLATMPRDADLDDLLQEVAVRLISRIDTLHEAANLRAWLRAVAVNVARSTARRAVIRRTVACDDLDAAAPGPGNASGFDESDRAVLELVRGLPETYREPLLMRAVSGMRSKEIGEALEISPATVDTRIARARRMLREQAEAVGTGGGIRS